MLEWDKDTIVNGDFYIHKNTLNTYIEEANMRLQNMMMLTS